MFKHATVLASGSITTQILEFLKSYKSLLTHISKKAKKSCEKPIIKYLIIKKNELFFSDGQIAIKANPDIETGDFEFILPIDDVLELIKYGACQYEFIVEKHTQFLFEEEAGEKEKQTKYHLILNNYSEKKMVCRTYLKPKDFKYEFLYQEIEKNIACRVTLPTNNILKLKKSLTKTNPKATIVISPQGIFGWTDKVLKVSLLSEDSVPLATQFSIETLSWLQKNVVYITDTFKIYQKSSLPFNTEIICNDIPFGTDDIIKSSNDTVAICEMKKELWRDFLNSQKPQILQAA